jgi:O-antigen/teichoic acid export membrane protein
MSAEQPEDTGSGAPQAFAGLRTLPPLSLRSNFAWTLAGNLTYAGFLWGILVVLAKLGSPEMVGRYALGLAVGAPVMMFTNLQLSALQATDAKGEYRFWDYFSLRLLTSSFALCVIAGIAAVGGYRLEAALVILIIGLAKGVESVSDAIHGLLQKNERLDLIAISKMIKGPLSLLAIWSLVHLTRSLVWGVIGLLAAWSLVLLTYDAYNARRMLHLRPEPIRGENEGRYDRLALFRRLTWLALPLGFVSLLDSLNVNVPRYLVERRLGEAALGYYAGMAYIMVAGNMVVGALTGSASPRLARLCVIHPLAFRRLLWRLIGLGAALGGTGLLLAMFFGRPLLALIYQPDYAKHADVFVWLMAAAGTGYVARFLICGMTASRRIKAQAPLYGVTLLATAVLSWVLIPRHGLLGAALALCAAMAVLLLGAAAITLAKPRAGIAREDSALAEAKTAAGFVPEEL